MTRVGEFSRSTGRTSARSRWAIAARVAGAIVIGAALPLAGVVSSVQAAEQGAECQAVFPGWRGAFDRIEYPATTPTSSHDSGNAVITYDDPTQGSSGTWSAETSVGQVVAVVIESDPVATPFVSPLPDLAGTWSTDASGVGPQLKAITLCYGLVPPATDTVGESVGPTVGVTLPFTDPQETEVATSPGQTDAPSVASTPFPATGGGGAPSQAPSTAVGGSTSPTPGPSAGPSTADVVTAFKKNCLAEASTAQTVDVTYDPAPRMQLNEPTPFRLAVAPPRTQLPQKTFGGQTTQDQVKVTCAISATFVVAAEDADVDPSGAKQQNYLPPEPVIWVWEVTPRTSGVVRANVVLEPVVLVQVPGGPLTPQTLTTKNLEVSIAVDMTLIDRIRSFTDQANVVLAAMTVIVSIATILGVRKWRRVVGDRARQLEALVGHDATAAPTEATATSIALAETADVGAPPEVHEPSTGAEGGGSHHQHGDNHGGHHGPDKGTHHHDGDKHGGHHDPDKGTHHHDGDKHGGHHDHKPD